MRGSERSPPGRSTVETRDDGHNRQMSRANVFPIANAHDLLIQGAVDYAIYMLDPQGYVMSWNPGAERIKGYAVEEIIGRHFSCFYTDEDRAAGVPAEALKTDRKSVV